MTTLYAEFTAKPGCAEEVAALIAGLANDVRTEPGNVVFEVYRQADNPNHFFVFEVYADEAAFQAHIGMSYGAVFNAKLNELIEEPNSQLTFLTPVSTTFGGNCS